MNIREIEPFLLEHNVQVEFFDGEPFVVSQYTTPDGEGEEFMPFPDWSFDKWMEWLGY